MPATPQQLFAFLDQLGVEHLTIEHPPFFTVEEGKPWHDRIPGAHGKNLFLKDKKDKVWLVVMPAEKRADIGRIEKQAGASRLSFGKPELLMDILGVPPGSVTPFALINDTQKRVTVIIDGDMLKDERVNFHPLHNGASTTVRAADLVKFMKALDYEPMVFDCGAAA